MTTPVLTIETALAYATSKLPQHRLSNPRIHWVDVDTKVVAIDLTDRSGLPDGTMDVWIEGNSLYGEW